MEVIKRVQYRWGLTKDVSRLDSLPGIEFLENDVPGDVRASIFRESILDLGGTRGDPSVGEPIEVDDIIVETTTRDVRIRVYNRGIHLISTSDDELTRIHRVCCTLQRFLPERRAPGVQAMRRDRSER